MPAEQPTIPATSGSFKPGSRTRRGFNRLLHHTVELSGASGRAPKVTHIGTAAGDQRAFNAELDEAARLAGFDSSHLNLLRMPNHADPEAHLLDQDVVRVSSGSDSEERRRPLAYRLVADGTLGETHCPAHGVGLLHHGTSLIAAVVDVRSSAYIVTRSEDAEGADEERLEPRYLG